MSKSNRDTEMMCDYPVKENHTQVKCNQATGCQVDALMKKDKRIRLYRTHGWTDIEKWSLVCCYCDEYGMIKGVWACLVDLTKEDSIPDEAGEGIWIELTWEIIKRPSFQQIMGSVVSALPDAHGAVDKNPVLCYEMVR
jgi:hypothetical protein